MYLSCSATIRVCTYILLFDVFTIARIITAKRRDDGRVFWPIKISIYPRPRRRQWCRAPVECILVFRDIVYVRVSHLV